MKYRVTHYENWCRVAFVEAPSKERAIEMCEGTLEHFCEPEYLDDQDDVECVEAM